MYKRDYSLKTRYNFRKVLRFGSEFRTTNLIIRYLKTDNPELTKKFAVIASNKLSNKAVDQNKVRRLISESIRKNLEKFPENYYYVFIPKKNVIESGKISTCVEEIDTEINTFLSKMAVVGPERNF